MAKEIKLNEKIDKKIINFISNNFYHDKTRSSMLKNYKKLCLFFDKESISINELDASYIINNCELICDMINIIGEIKELQVIDNNIELLINEYKYNKEIESNDLSDSFYSNNSVKIYLNEISKYTLLSREEEIELSKRIKEGDINALNTLIEHNLKLVVFIAKKYVKAGYSFEDVIQNGNIGLMKAANKFDGEFGCKFSTYAYWWINREIKIGCASLRGNIKYPTQVEEIHRKICAFIEKYKQDNFDIEPTNEEISQQLNIPLNKVEEYRMLPNTISISTTINSVDEFTLEDTLIDKKVNIEDDCIRKQKNIDIQNLIQCGLDQRSYEIIMLKYGKNNRMLSDKAIGEIYGLSSTRVRQIINKALIKLRKNRELAQLSENGYKYENTGYLFKLNIK